MLADFPLLLRSMRSLGRDRVWFGVPVGKNLEEVHQVVLLLGAKLEIAGLTVRLARGSCLRRRHSCDVQDVVEDLGRRKKRSVTGRGILAKIESDLLAVCVHRDVPLVVEVDDIFEALEDAVVHVCFHEVWRRLVRAGHTRRLKEAAELGDVARNILVESGPAGRRIGVGTQTLVDVLGSERIIPVGIGFLVGLLVVRVVDVLRDANIRITVHSERVFSLRTRLYRRYCRGGVALKALCLAEVQLPPAFL
jgi:hypothetical protein